MEKVETTIEIQAATAQALRAFTELCMRKAWPAALQVLKKYLESR